MNVSKMNFSTQHEICINTSLNSPFRNLYAEISWEIYEANLDLLWFHNSFNLKLLPKWNLEVSKAFKEVKLLFQFFFQLCLWIYTFWFLFWFLLWAFKTISVVDNKLYCIFYSIGRFLIIKFKDGVNIFIIQ